MLVVAVTAEILHTSLVILTEVDLIIPSVGTREAMERMSDLPMLQIQTPQKIITTVRGGM